MTYGQVKNQVLKLLNQYTVAGYPVATSYNNQEDYLRRIPELVNDALTEIATTVRKREQVLALTAETGTAVAQGYRFDMPADFFQFKSGDNFLVLHGELQRHQRYLYRGERTIVLEKYVVEHCEPLLIYYRLPTLLPEAPEDSAAIDTTADAQRAIPYYVAGMLALHDDAFLASTLMNAYEDKLAKLTPLPTTEAAPATDLYDFYCRGDFY